MITKVLVDANVLYSRTQRDWLFLLKFETEANMFTVHYTEDILAEWLYRLRRDHKDWPGGTITRLRDKLVAGMDSRVDDYLIDGSFPGSDEDDQHVHAAAVHGSMDLVLTCDAGFSNLDEETLDALPYEVKHPDDLFCLVDDCAPEAVQAVAAKQAKYYLGRDQEPHLPQALRKAGCPEFADRVRVRLQGLF